MAESNERNQTQAKKPFYVREIDASLLGRNSGLSKNARHLHLILRKLADARTGEVRLPNGHWYSPREIEREAEMSHNTRKAAMRELVTAGLAHRERPRHAVACKERLSGNLRNHVVWAEARYFVSPTPRSDWLSSTDQTQNTNTDAGSSTDQNKGDRRKPYKQRASSTDQNKNNPENTSSSASIAQSVGGPPNGRQVLQEAPKDLQPSASSLPLPLREPERSEGAFQDSPQPKPPAPIGAHSLTPQTQPADLEPTIDRSQAIALRKHARSHGWSKADLENYLFQFFSVRSPMRLTIVEYNHAYRRTQLPPSQPN